MSWSDRIVAQLDEAVRVTFGPPPDSTRPSPAAGMEPARLDEAERTHAAGLMRINHTGEVCAQALYTGQALAARKSHVRDKMNQAAREEEDHLAWCAQRLADLNSRPSLLNPLWYTGSFTLGALAGLAGDPWSLGFVAETERQVEAHLHEHLDRLPEADRASRAVVEQMKIDEARHADMAEAAGARALPKPVQQLMGAMANAMKTVAYRI